MISDGIRYVRSRPDLKLILVAVFFAGTFGMNFQMTSALMATQVFEKGPGEYGLLGTTLAIGSLTGALLGARRVGTATPAAGDPRRTRVRDRRDRARPDAVVRRLRGAHAAAGPVPADDAQRGEHDRPAERRPVDAGSRDGALHDAGDGRHPAGCADRRLGGRHVRCPLDPDRRRRDVRDRRLRGGAGLRWLSRATSCVCPATAPRPRPPPTRRWPPERPALDRRGQSRRHVRCRCRTARGRARSCARAARPGCRCGRSRRLGDPGQGRLHDRRCAPLAEAALVGGAELDELPGPVAGVRARRRALAGCAGRRPARRARPGAARSGAGRRPRPAAAPPAPPGARRGRPPGRSTRGCAGRRCRARPRRGSATRSGAATRRRAGR